MYDLIDRGCRRCGVVFSCDDWLSQYFSFSPKKRLSICCVFTAACRTHMRLLVTVLLAALVAASSVSALYDGTEKNVVVLTAENFDKEVTNSRSVWLVEFYAPWCGHCKQLSPEWKKAALALNGIAKLGVVDADKHGALGSRFGVEGFPTIKLFAGGQANKKPQEYEGGRTAKDIVAGVLKAVEALANQRLGKKPSAAGGGDEPEQEKGSDVVELSSSSFTSKVLASDEPWLVEFYAPWCGHCKSLAPEWKKAASLLKGKVNVAAIDATKHSAHNAKYGVQGFPTIKFFKNGKTAPIDYSGGRTSQAIADFASKNSK